MMRKLRILWTLPYLPWPTTSGGKLRQYHLLRCLAQRGHRITLLIQSKVPLDEDTRSALEPFLERLIVLPRRPLNHPRTLVTLLFSGYPLLACVNGFNTALRAKFTDLLQEPFDIVQIEHSYSFEPYSRMLAESGRPFLLTEHNVESALSTVTYRKLPLPLHALAGFDRRRYERFESAVLNASTQVIALTEQDAHVFKRITGRPPSIVVNGADVQVLSNVRPNPDAMRILYIGNFEYAPNVAAIDWIITDILPRIWRYEPRARLAVCGYALPERFVQHYKDPRIEWRGFVPDLAMVQAESSIFLAALRDGGGSKLKVLEAMAAGLPLVSTAQGVSGLTVRDRESYCAGEDAASLAQAVVTLLRSPELAQRVGAAGREYVTKNHSWNTATDQLEAVYEKFLGVQKI